MGVQDDAPPQVADDKKVLADGKARLNSHETLEIAHGKKIDILTQKGPWKNA